MGGLDVPNLRTAHCADYYAYFAPFTPVRSTAESLAARGCPTTYLIKSFGPNTGSRELRTSMVMITPSAMTPATDSSARAISRLRTGDDGGISS